MFILWIVLIALISFCTFIGCMVVFIGCYVIITGKDKSLDDGEFTFLSFMSAMVAGGLGLFLFFGPNFELPQPKFSPTHSLELNVEHITPWYGDTVLIYDTSTHPLPIQRSSDNHGKFIYGHCPRIHITFRGQG